MIIIHIIKLIINGLVYLFEQQQQQQHPSHLHPKQNRLVTSYSTGCFGKNHQHGEALIASFIPKNNNWGQLINLPHPKKASQTR